MTWECLRLDPNFRARPWGAPGKQRLWESHLNNSSWFPVERWLDLPLCEDFQYVVTLREPVPRLLHQCLEENGWVVSHTKSWEVGDVNECDACIQGCTDNIT